MIEIFAAVIAAAALLAVPVIADVLRRAAEQRQHHQRKLEELTAVINGALNGLNLLVADDETDKHVFGLSTEIYRARAIAVAHCPEAEQPLLASAQHIYRTGGARMQLKAAAEDPSSFAEGARKDLLPNLDEAGRFLIEAERLALAALKRAATLPTWTRFVLSDPPVETTKKDESTSV